MTVCDYAACGREATRSEDGWQFCATHLVEHHQLALNIDIFDLPPRQVGWCGTEAGAKRHYRAGGPLCEPCRVAMLQTDRDRRVRRAALKVAAVCGTPAGARGHRRAQEAVCDACREALRQAEELARPAPKVRELRPCGTHAAFVRHKGRGEMVCEECVVAERVFQAERFQRSKLAMTE